MTSGGRGEMLSPREQPLVNKCHSLQKYFLTCATLTDFYETRNKANQACYWSIPYFLNKAVS